MKGDEFLEHNLVDPKYWVADHKRTLCHVCMRSFSTFRRKHHCRMCGEVVCNSCTTYKNVVLLSIGRTRVRVCMSCIFTQSSNHKSNLFSPRHSIPSVVGTMSSEESERWLTNHLHSPLSKSFNRDFDTDSEHGQLSFDEHNNSGSNNNDEEDEDEEENSLDYSWEYPWPKPPVPADEDVRVRAVQELRIVQTHPEKRFDSICETAKARLSCPMAAVGFMEAQYQWFKASIGLTHRQLPRKISFCAYAVHSKESVVVLDTLKDRRFERNPLVTGSAEIRFYASAPVFDASRCHVVGTVFVLDKRPRESCDISILEGLADCVRDQLLQRHHDQQHEAEHRGETSIEMVIDQELKSIRQKKSQQQLGQVIDNNSSWASMVSTCSNGRETSSSCASSQMASPPALVLKRSADPNAPNGGGSAKLENMLMKLLAQNTETQEQLASQQLSLSSTLTHHSLQINKLMTDFARIEAKMESKTKSKLAVN